MRLANKVGPPVEGSDFYGREQEISACWEDLQEGNHLLITAPRRVGKSSLIKKLIAEAKNASWNAAYIDVQDVTSELEFYKIFADCLRSENEGWFHKNKHSICETLNGLFSRVELEFGPQDAPFKLKWSGGLVNEIKTEVIKLLENTSNLLIAIDELPFFLARLEIQENGRQRVSDFLHWLRAFRQKSQTKIRWVFCGSIGLDTFTHRLNLSESFNDILPFYIGAFDRPTAVDFLTKLGKDNNLPINSERSARIIDKLGWPLPYFLQAFFKQLKRIKATSPISTISEQDIDNAYDNIVRDISSLKTWEERLNEQLTIDQADVCKLILTQICKTKLGLTRKKLFDSLYNTFGDTKRCDDSLSFTLGLLENDGYIICQNRKYAFRSPLLRDFWYKIKVM